MAAQRTYGGVSAGQRRAQRRTALLDAALEIVADQGVSGLTVAGLCAGAGLNERYYYENFDSREAVLTGLVDRLAEELAGAIVAALDTAGPDSRAKAHAAISAGIHVLTDDPRKAGVAFAASTATPGLRARTTATARAFARLVAAQGTGHYTGDQDTTAAELDPVIDFHATYLVGGLIHTLTIWAQGDLALSRDELIDRTTDVFVLLGEDTARRLS